MDSSRDLPWKRSSFCANANNCVELAPTSPGVAVRDTKRGPGGPVLRFSSAEFAALLSSLRGG
ncbi:hypothetical protein GCM10009678_36130 [Actinomadura kijaniata]|uniref:DUF397 domain-containing protein n=1 Tax=Actinomadura namibiensis TaxID=182080 RepID=A0A7W3QM72_ACTNM|nr:DUF397 domain-containing protein [Actinomadura namibiensis]MBA8952211.1 hypothetical protein [Actinomadura namibiensis]